MASGLYEVITRHLYGELSMNTVRVWVQLDHKPTADECKGIKSYVEKSIQAFRSTRLSPDSLGEYLCARDVSINAVEVTDHFGLGYVYYREWP